MWVHPMSVMNRESWDAIRKLMFLEFSFCCHKKIQPTIIWWIIQQPFEMPSTQLVGRTQGKNAYTAEAGSLRQNYWCGWLKQYYAFDIVFVGRDSHTIVVSSTVPLASTINVWAIVIFAVSVMHAHKWSDGIPKLPLPSELDKCPICIHSPKRPWLRRCVCENRARELRGSET